VPADLLRPSTNASCQVADRPPVGDGGRRRWQAMVACWRMGPIPDAIAVRWAHRLRIDLPLGLEECQEYSGRADDWGARSPLTPARPWERGLAGEDRGRWDDFETPRRSLPLDPTHALPYGDCTGVTGCRWG